MNEETTAVRHCFACDQDLLAEDFDDWDTTGRCRTCTTLTTRLNAMAGKPLPFVMGAADATEEWHAILAPRQVKRKNVTFRELQPGETDESTKRCFKCEQTKPIVDFWLNRSRPDGRMNKCIDCARVQNARMAMDRAERRDMARTNTE